MFGCYEFDFSISISICLKCWRGCLRSITVNRHNRQCKEEKSRCKQSKKNFQIKIKYSTNRQVIGYVVAVLQCAINWRISNALALNCTFDVFPFHSVGGVYRCAGIISFDDANADKITAVNGTHSLDKRNVDVEGLIISSQNMEFFPVNIHSFFPNIKVLNFPLNSMSSVTNKHLTPFPNLEFLALFGNRITTLDSDLFTGLKSLKFINLGRNRIKHVGHDFILPAAAKIYLYSNLCIDKDAVTELEVTHLRFSLIMNCPSSETSQSGTSVGSTIPIDQIQILKDKYLQLEMRVSFMEAIIDSKRCFQIENPKFNWLKDANKK